MDILTAGLLVVAVTGTAVAVTRDVTSQAIVLAMHGLALSVLTLALQAPDVTLAVITIGAAVTPMLVLLAVASSRKTSAGQEK